MPAIGERTPPMKNFSHHALAAATVALISGAATAATQFGEHVTLTGFGTIGVTSTNTDQAQLRSDIRQGRGADKDIDFGVDSRLGLQANAKFNDTFSAVGQILVSRRISNSAALEWLYGQATLPAGFDVKLGRMVVPTFMVSDSRSVGYAAHWLRAPQEVYALYTSSSFDSGQLNYRTSMGPANLTVQLSAGETQSDAELAGRQVKLKNSNLRSINVLLETGDWLFRAGQTEADLSYTGLPIPTQQDKFSGLGVQYDNGTAIVMAEYATRRSPQSLVDSDSWYASAGWRFGAWTPYVTVSRFKPKGLAYPNRATESTEALGVRWNAMSNLAIKAQVQNTQGVSANFVNQTPSFFAAPPKVRVLSLAVDFVF